MRRPGLLSLIFFLLGSLSAQIPVFQFPKIPDELVLEQDLSLDPEAEATILLDYGEMGFGVVTGRLRVYYTYYREVKILKESGVRWATVEVPLAEDEDLSDVRGFTYSVLEETGKVQRLKMERKGVKEEFLSDGSRRKVFRLPLPRPGSVLAYSYSVVSEGYENLRSWEFQTTIPVLTSEYVTRIPEDFSYVTLFQGNADRLEQGASQYPLNMGLRIVPSSSGPPKVYATNSEEIEIQMVSMTRYRMNGVPALKKEPFMGSLADQVMRLQFELSRIGRSKRDGYDVLESWSEVGTYLMDHKDFGQRLESPGVWPRAWTELVNSSTRSKEHLFALFEAVRQAIRWDGEYTIFASRPLAEARQQSLGNGAEINLLLAALLQTADYRAYPVLLSTRDHGKAIPNIPVLSQFNHLVVMVEFRGERIFMDATQSLGPPDFLPLENLATQGFRVSSKRSGWVDIEPQYQRYRRTYTRLFLVEGGQLEGRISHLDKGYGAVRTRELLAEYPDEKSFFREEVLGEFVDVRMGKTLVTGRNELSEPTSTRCEFETSDYITRSGDLILLSPLLSEGYEVNPFPNEPRQTPIDFGVPISEQFVMVLTLPEGYHYEVVPEDIVVSLPNGAATFMYKTKVINQHIQLLSRITINQAVFPPEQYDLIRLFFQHIATKHGERIIVKKMR